MNDVRAETPRFSEIVAVLRDSGLVLREGTRIERRKRWQSLDGGLEGALSACSSATKEGRTTAEEYLFRTREALQQARDSMGRVAYSRGGAVSTGQDSDLMEQLQELVDDLEKQLLTIENVLNRKSDRASAYNITLFGRTGAGKSTLMEILTGGEGKTIGKGAQRATRDVRSYEWKGLMITDVPGVAAFEGEEDAETAHEAAKEADLILFLVTDDAPQPAEARHLARLRMTGHPIIGVCNVKSSLGSKAEERLFVRDSHKTFDHYRLDGIRKQFDEISDQFNPGQELPLIYTHLLARFTANRAQQEGLAEELKEESRFWEVEDAIAEEIAGNGSYLRTRSYTDMATEAALGASELLLHSASLMTQLHERVGARVEEMKKWRRAFRRKADRKLQELLSGTTGKLRNQMTPFAERNWKDEKNLSQMWNEKIQSARIDDRLREYLEELHGEMSTHLREIETDISAELRLLAGLNTAFSGSFRGTPNFQRWVKWTSTALGNAITLVGNALMFFGPIGAPIGAGIAIGGQIFRWIGNKLGGLLKSEEQRRGKAVSRFREIALPHIERIENEIGKSYRTSFDEEIDLKAAAAIAKLSVMVESAREAGGIARELGAEQQRSLAELNKATVSQTLVHIGHQEQTRRVDRAARIPGQAVTLVLTRGEPPSEEVFRQVETLLGERITTITKGTSASSIIRKATGTKTLSIDQEAGTAEAAYNAVDPAIKIEVRLASQLTGLHVLNRPQEA